MSEDNKMVPPAKAGEESAAGDYTKGPLSILVHDYSAVGFYGDDEFVEYADMSPILLFGPCSSCLEHARARNEGKLPQEIPFAWGGCKSPSKADAERLVDCWNVMQGVENPSDLLPLIQSYLEKNNLASLSSSQSEGTK